MDSGLLNGSEDSSGLDNILGTSAGPVDVSRISLTEDDNLGSVDVQEGAIVFHLTYEKNLKLYSSSMTKI